MLERISAAPQAVRREAADAGAMASARQTQDARQARDGLRVHFSRRGRCMGYPSATARGTRVGRTARTMGRSGWMVATRPQREHTLAYENHAATARVSFAIQPEIMAWLHMPPLALASLHCADVSAAGFPAS